jgi:uncharacterized protein YcbX
MRVGVVSDLWRFPVKSFGGERGRRVFLGPFGFLGDRRCAVMDPANGRPMTARRAPALLGYQARFGDPARGEDVTVEAPGGSRWAWDDPALADDIRQHLGRDPEDPLMVVRSPMAIHDAAPVHVVTEASIAQMSEWLGDEVDRRRFRANVVVETDDGMAFSEAAWPGHRIRFGADAEIDVVIDTERCAVTTWDPDTIERDTRVLAAIARERENFFGVYCRVVKPGWVAVGDPVMLTT